MPARRQPTRRRQGAGRLAVDPSYSWCPDGSGLASRRTVAHAEAIEEEAFRPGEDASRRQSKDVTLVEEEVDGERGEDGVGQIFGVEWWALAIFDGAAQKA